MKTRPWLVCLLAAVVLGGVALAVLTGGEAEAGFTSQKTKELVDYLKTDAPFNQKLMALDALRKKSESGIEGELEKIAKGSDKELAVFAATALGKKKSSDAKKKLKSILENTKIDTSG